MEKGRMILKTNTTIGQTLRVALLATTVGLGATAWSAPAFAQDEAASKDEGQSIVITGSRIQRKDLVANSPTITVDKQFLQESSTAAIEQSLNKLPQFVVSQSSTVKNNEGTLVAAGGDIQPNATNTPGAATVSLRGIGANRTPRPDRRPPWPSRQRLGRCRHFDHSIRCA